MGGGSSVVEGRERKAEAGLLDMGSIWQHM